MVGFTKYLNPTLETYFLCISFAVLSNNFQLIKIYLLYVDIGLGAGLYVKISSNLLQHLIGLLCSHFPLIL